MKMKKDKHNFHVSPVKGWEYFGDVNIEFGGVFFKTADLSELDQCLKAGDSKFPLIGCLSVTEVDDWDRVFKLNTCPVYIDAKRIDAAIALCKENGIEPVTSEIAYCTQVYYGQETTHVETVRLGRRTENARRYPEPDTILAHNACLANYVRKVLKAL